MVDIFTRRKLLKLTPRLKETLKQTLPSVTDEKIKERSAAFFNN